MGGMRGGEGGGMRGGEGGGMRGGEGGGMRGGEGGGMRGGEGGGMRGREGGGMRGGEGGGMRGGEGGGMRDMLPTSWNEQYKMVPCIVMKSPSDIETGFNTSPTRGSICTGYFIPCPTLQKRKKNDYNFTKATSPTYTCSIIFLTLPIFSTHITLTTS